MYYGGVLGTVSMDGKIEIDSKRRPAESGYKFHQNNFDLTKVHTELIMVRLL